MYTASEWLQWKERTLQYGLPVVGGADMHVDLIPPSDPRLAELVESLRPKQEDADAAT